MFIFGTIYFGNALEGAQLILLEQGLYADDWSAFGAFVAAPVGGLLWGFGALAVRLGYHWVHAKVKGHRFDALDRPACLDTHVNEEGEYAGSNEIRNDVQAALVTADHKGKVF